MKDFPHITLHTHVNTGAVRAVRAHFKCFNSRSGVASRRIGLLKAAFVMELIGAALVAAAFWIFYLAL